MFLRLMIIARRPSSASAAAGLSRRDDAHILGTDELGRDILSRLIYAIRFSILVAIGGTAIGALVGTILGFLAAHFRGLVEEAIMMMADVQASLPFMLIALALIAAFGGSFMLFILIMGFYGWEVFARLTRGVVISAKGQGYATAMTALGAPPFYIYTRHILPNILSVLVVQFTLNFPASDPARNILKLSRPWHPPPARQASGKCSVPAALISLPLGGSRYCRERSSS